MKPTIIIDAGHGGFDKGASYEGREEKDDNLRLALAVGDRLQEMGFLVVYTRTTDVYQRPIEKARIANDAEGDYFVSFHRNSSPNANTYSGIQTLVYEDSGEPAALAAGINEALARTGFADLGVKERPDLIVLRRTRMPAVLIEAGFINTDADNAKFDADFDKIADAIAGGIANEVSPSEQRYGVQVGLFRRYENAQYLLEQFLEEGYTAEIRDWRGYYAVVVGNEETIEGARQLERDLQRKGYETLLVNL